MKNICSNYDKQINLCYLNRFYFESVKKESKKTENRCVIPVSSIQYHVSSIKYPAAIYNLPWPGKSYQLFCNL
jgi:hypothetical protein